MRPLSCKRFLPLLYVIPLLCYELYYFRSFFPIVEGWFSAYGTLIRAGNIPYVDFSLALPPLYPLQIAGLQALFGEELIALRWAGLVLTCGLWLLLYLILCEICNRWVAAFSALIGIIYYTSRGTYLGYDFHEFLTLTMLLACLCLLYYAKRIFASPSQPADRLCFAVGWWLGLSLLTVQSTGGLVLICTALAMAILALRVLPLKIALRHGCIAAGGVLTPLMLLAAWLGMHGALGAFISSVSSGAIAAKGGLISDITNWRTDFTLDSFLPRTAELAWRLGQLVLVISALSAITYGIFFRKRAAFTLPWRMHSGDPVDKQAFIVCTAGAASLLAFIVMTYYRTYSLSIQAIGYALDLQKETILFSVDLYVFGSVAAILAYSLRPRLASARYLILLLFGFGLLAGNGTSAGICEVSAYFAIALLVAYSIQCSLPYILPALVPLVLALVFSGLLIELKFITPFDWWYAHATDVRNFTCGRTDGLLTGLCLPQDEYDHIMRIVQDIDHASEPDEPVYIYSHMPIFNLMAQRPFYKGVVTSWFDTMNDRQAEALAKELLASPPPVIVMARMPERAYAEHETLFRGGHPLGQRGIVEAVAQLEREKRIARIDTVDDVTGITFDVYATNKTR